MQNLLLRKQKPKGKVTQKVFKTKKLRKLNRNTNTQKAFKNKSRTKKYKQKTC